MKHSKLGTLFHSILFATTFTMLSPSAEASSGAPKELKDWTLLVFLNANNNLDSFGDDDLNEMESVGSTDQINVVVQWASYRRDSVKRLYIEKDEDSQTVTSPILEELGSVDMGDWRNLVEFVRWAKIHYPAKRYFIDVWNHGSGWHRKRLSDGVAVQDISYDDKTGNAITTEELGEAMREASQILGQKVDIYGSDACLMAMAEVASEMSDSVHVFVGAQEVEPAEGWPYGDFLNAWKSLGSDTNAATVAQTLATEFKKSYQGGSQGRREITLSAFDLNKTTELHEAMNAFSTWILNSPSNVFGSFRSALNQSLDFYYTDYIDLGDFASKLAARFPTSERSAADNLQFAIRNYVIVNEVTEAYRNASGVSIWIPSGLWSYESRQLRYSLLQFPQATGWHSVLDRFLRPARQLEL